MARLIWNDLKLHTFFANMSKVCLTWLFYCAVPLLRLLQRIRNNRFIFNKLCNIMQAVRTKWVKVAMSWNWRYASERPYRTAYIWTDTKTNRMVKRSAIALAFALAKIADFHQSSRFRFFSSLFFPFSLFVHSRFSFLSLQLLYFCFRFSTFDTCNWRNIHDARSLPRKTRI